MKAKIEADLDQTRQQASVVESCIERRGGDTSGLSGVFVGDEMIKGAMESYTFEQMEIAAYRILIAAAEGWRF